MIRLAIKEMTESVKPLLAPGFPANDAKAAPEPKSAAVASANQPVRLVVEPIHGGESYTYKLYDRATGALLIELPREEATKMGQGQDYAAGQVLDTTA